MIDSVAGAPARPMPAPMKSIAIAEPAVAGGRGDGRGDREAAGERQHPGGHDPLGAEARRRASTTCGAATIIAPAYGSMRRPAADGE